jgi:rhodanese-related sulfurtransferase
MKFRNLFSICAFVLLGACRGQTEGVQKLSPQEFAEKLKSTENPQLIDVRTLQEFSGEHLEGALNADWNSGVLEKKIPAFDRSKPVFVYCKVGGRSAQAAAKLYESGFKEVYDLQGGFLKWTAAGLPVANRQTDSARGMDKVGFDKLVSAGPRVLVNFFAGWCEPCRKMKPYMEKLSVDGLKVVRLDADANKALLKEMKIDTLPVIQLYENGKLVWAHSGYITEDELKKHIQ